MADYNSIHTGAEIDTAVSAVSGNTTDIATNTTDTATNTQDIADLKSKLGGVAGVLFDFGGATAPAGALSCDGSEVSKTTYSDLYAAIGDVWANTAGATAPTAGNFRLPPQEKDGLGLYNRGVGGTNGSVGTYQDDVFKSHRHELKFKSNQRAIGSGDTVGSAGTTASASPMNYTGDPDETRPRSITVLKCIWTGK